METEALRSACARGRNWVTTGAGMLNLSTMQPQLKMVAGSGSSWPQILLRYTSTYRRGGVNDINLRAAPSNGELREYEKQRSQPIKTGGATTAALACEEFECTLAMRVLR